MERQPGAVITIDGAVVAFRDNVALRGVSLRVMPGEFIGIIGPNGAGKTTLLTLVNGLRTPTRGSVSVLGHDMASNGRHQVRRLIGYVPQVSRLDERMPMTVRDVVMIGRYGVLGLFRHPGRRDWQIVDQVLEQVGMAHLARRPIGHLSGGERQKVAIARCLAQEPGILLLDEPVASLDWRAQEEVLCLVSRIHAERHLTILLVTHDLRALPVDCDRALLVKDGLIWGEGTPAEVFTDDRLASLYGMPLAAVARRRGA